MIRASFLVFVVGAILCNLADQLLGYDMPFLPSVCHKVIYMAWGAMLVDAFKLSRRHPWPSDKTPRR